MNWCFHPYKSFKGLDQLSKLSDIKYNPISSLYLDIITFHQLNKQHNIIKALIFSSTSVSSGLFLLLYNFMLNPTKEYNIIFSVYLYSISLVIHMITAISRCVGHMFTCPKIFPPIMIGELLTIILYLIGSLYIITNYVQLSNILYCPIIIIVICVVDIISTGINFHRIYIDKQNYISLDSPSPVIYSGTIYYHDLDKN